MIQANVTEDDEQTMAQFLNGLNHPIKKIADFQPYSNLIELTMANDDGLVKPEQMEFGQQVEIISDGVAYRSILTGRERGKNTKLVFGTVRLDLTKILRRNSNGQ